MSCDDAALRSAREAFRRHAGEVYGAGEAAAERDAHALEAIAERLVRLVESLEPAFARLEIGGDVALYRGPVLTRVRGRYRVQDLAPRLADALGEDLLSATAQAVLVAAARGLATPFGDRAGQAFGGDGG